MFLTVLPAQHLSSDIARGIGESCCTHHLCGIYIPNDKVQYEYTSLESQQKLEDALASGQEKQMIKFHLMLPEGNGQYSRNFLYERFIGNNADV